MSIRVLMTRRFPSLHGGHGAELLPVLSSMLVEIRTMAFQQPGYISGETMRNIDDPNEYLVISTWKTVEDWNRWFADKRREELEGKIDVLLGSHTQYKVYTYD